MESSEIFEANDLAVPSPNGQYIASITPQHLYIQYAHSLNTAFTFSFSQTQGTSKQPPAVTRNATTHTPSIQWSHTSEHILLLTPIGVAVFSLSDTERRAHISNGSAGLGRIVSADMIGLKTGHEQVLVVWEFGRIGVWDLGTGRAAEEIGEIKVGNGRLSGCWGIRTADGKSEVLAILGRSAAQDTLSLFLPPSTVPFTTVNLPTVDAQSISWTDNWLAVLDSPLASPAPTLHVFTPDGHLFRQYPSPGLPVPTECDEPMNTAALDDNLTAIGPRSMAWSGTHLALASSLDSSISLLSTRTFIGVAATDPSAIPPDFCHEETISAKGGAQGARTYNLLASNSIPMPRGGRSQWGPAVEMRFSARGKFLATRYEGNPSAILIWRMAALSTASVGARIDTKMAKVGAPTMIQQHAAIKRISWHPGRESLMMILSEDDTANGSNPRAEQGTAGAGVYFFDAGIDQPPLFVSHHLSSLPGTEIGRTDVQFVTSKHLHCRPGSAGGNMKSEELSRAAKEKLKVVASSRKRGWFLLYPEGREEDEGEQTQLSKSLAVPSTPGRRPTGQHQLTPARLGAQDEQDDEDEDVSQDSLYDILTGRTPAPEYQGGRSEVMEEDEDEDEDMTGQGLEDTFREKKNRPDQTMASSGTETGSIKSWDDEMF